MSERLMLLITGDAAEADHLSRFPGIFTGKTN
jgi:hypothetical protein